MTITSPDDDRRPAARTASTGAQWHLGHGHQRAVVTEVGATLRTFGVDGRPVIDGFGPAEWSHGGRGQVLAPWPNRLGDGRYRFGGLEGQAALDEPRLHNAIHGLVRWLPWRMVGRAQNRVSLACDLFATPAYPFRLGLTVEYRLGRDGLTVITTAENRGENDLPFGIGFHPYLTVGTPAVDRVKLTLRAGERLVADERGLPTGSVPVDGTEYDFNGGRIIDVTRLDTAYTALGRDDDGRAWAELEHPDDDTATSLWADEHFRYLMVFTGDTLDQRSRRRALAVEPMSCPPDALRSGTDLVALRPGATWEASWGIVPGRPG